MDKKTLIGRLKGDAALGIAFNREVGAGLDDQGAVGIGFERFSLASSKHHKKVAAR